MDKQCFKCKETKIISEFYKHPMMGDGHLGKCKTCAKRDVAERVDKLSKNPDWIEMERARCRAKQVRYRKSGRVKKYPRKRQLSKEKRRAYNAARRAKYAGKLVPAKRCEMCESAPPKDMHHHDYSRPLEIVWLCHACHGIIHRKHKSIPIGNRKP